MKSLPQPYEDSKWRLRLQASLQVTPSQALLILWTGNAKCGGSVSCRERRLQSHPRHPESVILTCIVFSLGQAKQPGAMRDEAAGCQDHNPNRHANFQKAE